MVSIININNDIKGLTSGYQNCNVTQILIFGAFVKVRDSLYLVDKPHRLLVNGMHSIIVCL
jgi:hypothetical protein